MVVNSCKNCLHKAEKIVKSCSIRIFEGNERHNEAPVKLNDFWPSEVLVCGKFSWAVEEDRVLQ